VKIRRIFIPLILFILLPLLTFANENSLKNLLPGDEIAPGFRAKAAPRIYDALNLHEYMDGEAEIYREYGVIKFAAQVYSKDKEEIKVDIAEMVDSISAYGIYSFYRSPDLNRIEIGDEGVISGNQISFWQDRYYLKITAFGTGAEVFTTATNLAKETSSRIAGHAKVPEIIALLPSKDRIKGSEKLIKGILALNNQYYLFQEDLFNFRAKAVGAFAEYGIPEKKIRLFIVEYPSADEARNALIRISEEKKKNARLKHWHRNDKKRIDTLLFQATDKSMALHRKGNLLALVIGTDEVGVLSLLYELRW
jgi:hypothetical protein